MDKNRLEISNLRTDPRQLAVPRGSDSVFVHLLFDYRDDLNNIRGLLIDEISPDGVEKQRFHNNPADLKRIGIDGANGSAHYRAQLSSKASPGTYKYSVRLLDDQERLGNEATTTLELVEHGDSPLAIHRITPAGIWPGVLLTIEGHGFDFASPLENIVIIGGQVAAVKKVSEDSMLVEVPPGILGGSVELINDHGRTLFEDLVIEPTDSGGCAGGEFSYMGRRFFSGAEDAFCIQVFGPDPGAAPPTHFDSSSSGIVVGTTVDVTWCVYCNPFENALLCDFAFTSSNPAVLTITPAVIPVTVGIRAVHVRYVAHSIGTAVVTGTGGSTHRVSVIAEPAQPDTPGTPDAAPPPAIPAPRGRFIDPPHGGFASIDAGSAGSRHRNFEWEVFAGAGGASLSVMVSDPAVLEPRLSLPGVPSTSPPTINEGLTSGGQLYFSAANISRPSVGVTVAITATNNNGGLSSRIDTVIFVLRVPDLTVNGSSAAATEIDFGPVQRGQSVTRQLTLGAVNGSSLAIGQMEDPNGDILFRSDSPWKIQSSSSRYRLSTGQSHTFDIEFAPTDIRHLGGHRATLIFRGNQPNGPINTVTLRAQAVPAPKLGVRGAPDDTLDFGIVPAEDSTYRQIVIENEGDTGSELTGSVTLGAGGSNAFTIAEGGGDFRLLAGQHKTIRIALSHPSPIAHEKLLLITSNDLDAERKSISLRGENARVRLLVRVFIPYPFLRDPACGWCYGGDNRSFSATYGTHRLAQLAEFDLGSGHVYGHPPETGITYEISCTHNNLFNRSGNHYEPLVLDWAKADEACLSQQVYVLSDTWLAVHFGADCPIPLFCLTPFVNPPAINYSLNVYINRYTKRVAITGSHDGFPAYEVYSSINNRAWVRIHEYMPESPGYALSLFAPFPDVELPRLYLEEHRTQLQWELREAREILPGGVLDDE